MLSENEPEPDFSQGWRGRRGKAMSCLVGCVQQGGDGGRMGLLFKYYCDCAGNSVCVFVCGHWGNYPESQDESEGVE